MTTTPSLAGKPNLVPLPFAAGAGGNGKRSGAIGTARWEAHMRATGMGLGGGSGWAILAFELDTAELRTIWSGHHTQSLALSSYQMDA